MIRALRDREAAQCAMHATSSWRKLFEIVTRKLGRAFDDATAVKHFGVIGALTPNAVARSTRHTAVEDDRASGRRERLHAGVLAASSWTVRNQPTVCVTPTADRSDRRARRRAPTAITLKGMTDDLILRRCSERTSRGRVNLCARQTACTARRTDAGRRGTHLRPFVSPLMIQPERVVPWQQV